MVIESFGGLTRFAKALGHTHVTTVQGWKDRGAIPLRHHARILDVARSLGIQLRRGDLLDEIPLADTSDEDAARAQCYLLLAQLLSAPPSAKLLEIARGLRSDGSELGQALNALASVAQRTTVEAAEREYSALFIGLSRGELLPYASYYLTGFLQEKPLAESARRPGCPRHRARRRRAGAGRPYRDRVRDDGRAHRGHVRQGRPRCRSSSAFSRAMSAYGPRASSRICRQRKPRSCTCRSAASAASS